MRPGSFRNLISFAKHSGSVAQVLPVNSWLLLKKLMLVPARGPAKYKSAFYFARSFHRLSRLKIRSKSCVIRLPLEFHFTTCCDHYCDTHQDLHSLFRLQ